MSVNWIRLTFDVAPSCIGFTFQLASLKMSEDEAIKHEEPKGDSPVDADVTDKDKENVEEEVLFDEGVIEEPVDPEISAQKEIISKTEPSSELEVALSVVLKRKDAHIARLTGEINKLKAFISKRKQTYKRKRKDEGAPTRALSAYNIFVQERFAQLAKENEKALRSADADAQLKRVPPSNLVASTGNEWKELAAEEKAKYEER